MAPNTRFRKSSSTKSGKQRQPQGRRCNVTSLNRMHQKLGHLPRPYWDTYWCTIQLPTRRMEGRKINTSSVSSPPTPLTTRSLSFTMLESSTSTNATDCVVKILLLCKHWNSTSLTRLDKPRLIPTRLWWRRRIHYRRPRRSWSADIAQAASKVGSSFTNQVATIDPSNPCRHAPQQKTTSIEYGITWRSL